MEEAAARSSEMLFSYTSLYGIPTQKTTTWIFITVKSSYHIFS